MFSWPCLVRSSSPGSPPSRNLPQLPTLCPFPSLSQHGVCQAPLHKQLFSLITPFRGLSDTPAQANFPLVHISVSLAGSQDTTLQQESYSAERNVPEGPGRSHLPGDSSSLLLQFQSMFYSMGKMCLGLEAEGRKNTGRMERSNRWKCAKGDEEASRSPQSIHGHKLGKNCHPVLKTPPRKGRQERDTREPMTSRPADLLWRPNGSTQRVGQALPPGAAGAVQVRERLQVSEEKRNEGREEMHKANLSGDTLEVVW